MTAKLPSKVWTSVACRFRRVAAFSWATFLVLASLTAAAEPEKKIGPPEKKPLPAVIPPNPAIVAAANIVGVGQAPSVVALFGAGRSMALWGDWPSKGPRVTPAKAEPIDPDLLAAVKDLTSSANPKEVENESRARDEAIVVASQTSARAFANSAAETKGVTFGQLLGAPRDFRGKVIHVEGRLASLKRTAPSEFAAAQGVQNLYECLIFTDPWQSTSALAIVSELPAGVKTGSRQRVAVDGYFFKEHLRQSGKEFRIMPLLIGRTLTLLKGPGPGADQTSAPSLDNLLFGVRDQRPLPSPSGSPEEYWAYCETIALAAATEPKAFAASAQANVNVTFAHLHDDPDGYRGKVIPIDGVLKRVLEIEVPPSLRDRGVRHLYEGWTYGKTLGSNPFYVTFTELPRNIKAGRDVTYEVVFNGYFFKKLVYQAQKDKGKEGRYTPMLIGRTVALGGSGHRRPARLAKGEGQEPEFNELAPRLEDHIDRASLDDVEDKKPIPAEAARNPGEFTAWCETVLLASRTSGKAFAASAEANQAVTYKQLMKEPAKLRGAVVHISGRLKRLRVANPPGYLQDRGINRLYEGWILGKGWGSRPCCVIFIDLPRGIRVDEDLNYPVEVDGYFFKEYRYLAAKDRYDAPYLVGRTIALRKSDDQAWASSFRSYFVIGVTVLLGGTLLLLVGLTWWFRRSDRRIRARLLEALREPSFGSGDGGEALAEAPQSADNPNLLVDHEAGPPKPAENGARGQEFARDAKDFSGSET
jgi:hypothetical protein